MKEKNPLISIVIPVYRTQSYLRECMESVLMQDYPKLEIILVDDGSPDACPEMCDAYARQYKEVRVIHQENSGLGMARNAGMDLAGGEYIFFLDSDDKLVGPAAVCKLAACAQKRSGHCSGQLPAVLRAGGQCSECYTSARQKRYRNSRFPVSGVLQIRTSGLSLGQAVPDGFFEKI